MEFAKILFGQPLPPAALAWRTPKVTCHAPGQVLTLIIDLRQRSLAFMATRDVVVVRHCGLAAFPPRLTAGDTGKHRLVTRQAF
jgi:hypothetical protein